MQREEKMLEAALDAILQRINELKASTRSLIHKLEVDPTVSWPSVLDSFAVISGQVLFLIISDLISIILPFHSLMNKICSHAHVILSWQ